MLVFKNKKPSLTQSAPTKDTMPDPLRKNHLSEQNPHPLSAQPQKSCTQTSWSLRLKQGLAYSRNKLNKSLALMVGGGKINDDLYEELETALLMSDMGIEATTVLLKKVRDKVSYHGLKDVNELKAGLKEALCELLTPLERRINIDQTKPYVWMIVGVNGAGKTTTIGKLAYQIETAERRVICGAGDTFRAAAKEQLIAWGQKYNIPVITQQKGDSAAVCFDTVEAAKARHKDVVLLDTAGRLPTQLHLMEELKKVQRVIKKSIPEAPHEVLLVLDANIGQNTLNQVAAFDDALGLTGLILTKLDGTAKGGVIAALASFRPVPVLFLGVGESVDDLKPFVAKDFVNAFFDD